MDEGAYADPLFLIDHACNACNEGGRMSALDGHVAMWS
jgi:hypothetical protein